MSLIYRAIWQDQDMPDVCGLAADTFTRWVTRKWRSITVPDNGVVHGAGEQDGEQVELEVRTAIASDAGAGIPGVYRADLIETRDGAARWHTTLRSWEATEPGGSQSERWIWVDVEVVGDVDIARLASAAPRLVNDLLAAGEAAVVDGDVLMPVSTQITGFAAGELLAELISRPGRTLPVVVLNDNSPRSVQGGPTRSVLARRRRRRPPRHSGHRGRLHHRQRRCRRNHRRAR